VNDESYQFAATGKAESPLVSPEGGKEPLRAEYSAYTMGSDHDAYQDSSFGIPAIYLNDWPDRFIHTNLDSAANIDATKLKRAGFIGAASGYFLARNDPDARDLVKGVIWQGKAVRSAQGLVRLNQLGKATEKCKFLQHTGGFEVAVESSTDSLQTKVPAYIPQRYEDYICVPSDSGLSQTPSRDEGNTPKWRRVAQPKGPMAVFGFDYFEVEWAKRGHTTKPKLLEYEGLWGGGEEYAYEVLNFADGKRNAQDIRDAVSEEYGPVALELVVEYLKALEEIGVVEKTK